MLIETAGVDVIRRASLPYSDSVMRMWRSSMIPYQMVYLLSSLTNKDLINGSSQFSFSLSGDRPLDRRSRKGDGVYIYVAIRPDEPLDWNRFSTLVF